MWVNMLVVSVILAATSTWANAADAAPSVASDGSNLIAQAGAGGDVFLKNDGGEIKFVPISYTSEVRLPPGRDGPLTQQCHLTICRLVLFVFPLFMLTFACKLMPARRISGFRK